MSNEKPKIEVTLLSKEEVKRKSKVLQKVGRGCEKCYWTSSIKRCNDYGLFVDRSGYLGCSGVSFSYGVRPVLKTDNLDELINGCKREMKNGIQIVEYGQFPNLYEEAEINNLSFLKETGKKYSLPPQDILIENFVLESFPEYDYNGKKVIKNYYKKYFPVKPVRFYIDRENSMLISTDALFRSPIDSYHIGSDYTDFKTSQLYQYLNSKFIKGLFMSVNTSKKEDDIALQQETADALKKLSTENEELKSKIQRKEELLERLKELVKENESLRIQSSNLDFEIEKTVSQASSKKHTKTLHL